MKFLCYLKEHSKSVTPGYSWQSFKDFLKMVKGTFLVGAGMAKWLALKTGSLKHCLNGVEIYYNAVSNFGMKDFEIDNPIADCKLPCAKLLANPTRGLNDTTV